MGFWSKLFGRKEKQDRPAYQLTWLTNQLAAGPAPMSYAQLDSIHQQGVDAILNLCGEFSDLHTIEEGHGFEVYHLPIHDEEAPELEPLEEALSWLDESLYLGKKVLVHCRHGIGRTGTLLNSYFVRRGWSPKKAAKKLDKMRSHPVNRSQWKAICSYGTRSCPLTVREPSLEFGHKVELAPFIKDYQLLVEKADDLVRYERGEEPRCGRDHARCCSAPLRLSLVEAVHIVQRLNVELSSRRRNQVIEDARESGQAIRKLENEMDMGDTELCLTDSGVPCPLLEEKQCLLFEYRPLQCRLFDLPESMTEEFYENVLSPVLQRLSEEMFVAFAGTLPPKQLPSFRLSDVVSGRYVNTFFDLLKNNHALQPRHSHSGDKEESTKG